MSFPSSPRRASRSRPQPRPLRRRSGVARHGSARAGAQRRAGARVIRSKSVRPAVLDHSSSSSPGPTSSARASWCRSGLASSRRRLPTWAAPPVMMPPLSATSRVMKIGLSSDERLPDRAVDDRLLDDPSSACCACPAWPTSAIWGERLKTAAGAGRSRTAAQLTASRSTRSWRPPRTPSTRVSEVFRRGARSARADSIETPNQRLAIRHVLPIIAPDDLSKVGVEESGRQAARCSATSPTWWTDHPAADRRRRHQRRPRPAARRREVSVGQHARGDARGRGGAGRVAARPARRRDRLARSSGRPPSSRWRSTISPWRCSSAVLLVIAGPGRLPVRVAHGADQPGGDPAVADGGGARAPPARRNHQHDDPGGAGDRPRRRRRRRDHRRREHRAAPASASQGGQRRVDPRRIILEASLEVRSADRLRDADRRRGRCCRSSSWRACPARSSEPLALSYVLAVLASMVVALTVTPALCLILLRKAPLERREPPLVAGCKRGYGTALARIITAPRPAFATVGASSRGRSRGDCRCSGSRSFPTSRSATS